MDTINVMSLCSGGGGLDLGFKLAVGSARTVCWVEWEAFAAAYLADRMEAKFLDEAPLWSDLRTFNGKPWRGVVDCLLAGYPCQPFSLAGRRRGSDDPRHLWPHVARVVEEVQPAVCFFENVSGHLSLGFGEVVERLEKMGRKVAAGLFTAEEVGASHRRERLFILAVGNPVKELLEWRGPARDRGTEHPDTSGVVEHNQGIGRREGRAESTLHCRGYPAASSGGELADPDKPGLSNSGNRSGTPQTGNVGTRPATYGSRGVFPPPPGNSDAWRTILTGDDTLAPAQSKVRLLADGLADDRARCLKLLGNGVVPLQAAYAFCSLWAALRL